MNLIWISLWSDVLDVFMRNNYFSFNWRYDFIGVGGLETQMETGVLLTINLSRTVIVYVLFYTLGFQTNIQKGYMA